MRDWPLAYAQAQGIEDWKAWYRSHYFVAYSHLFTLNQRRAFSHNVVYCKEVYWKGVACRLETFVMVSKELNVSSYYKTANILNLLIQQNKELFGIYEDQKGGSWPAIADDIVLLMDQKKVLGFSLSRGNPYGTQGLTFEFENVLAFSTYESSVGLLFADRIDLYNMLVNDPGRRGSLVKTFAFTSTESKQAVLHLTRNRIIGLFPNQKLLIFDIEKHGRAMAILQLQPGNWTFKGDLLYYHDAERLYEIDLITGTFKRVLKLPPHIALKVFSNSGRMACGKDYLALMAGDARLLDDGLFLYVVNLKDFTLTGSRQMDRTDGHLQAYDNLLMIGRECDDYNMNTKRKGMVGILDLESREFLDHLPCTGIGARPFFYDGKIVAVSSDFIDFWKIEGIKTTPPRRDRSKAEFQH
ncbi:MAG: hypothetical protein LLG04_17945 [Parachlamydia sp.]|nr:hypothetical protein [Parachlamydia sp.]